MPSKIEGKAKVIACSWNDIKGQITSETSIKNFEKRKI